jgi:predicted GNAT family acetyltransferase
VGKQLVTQAVEFARKKGIKIVPLCSFTQKVLDTTPEFKDVL